ncbi:MAG: hypothetical protein Q8882_05890 [Bacillota bacterium]|nr:hypothetical protein [Bacillota bacterium]
MDAKKIVYNYIFKPFENKRQRHIGVELEFPLINKELKDVDTAFASDIFTHFKQYGFNPSIVENGEILFAENSEKDCISFDNSYNNFEFSMNHGDNLLEIKHRFDNYYRLAFEYFLKQNHCLVGRGTNPNKKHITANPVPFSSYIMVKKYLTLVRGEHGMYDFPAYLSSVQTHLDAELSELPFLYTLFAKLDFVRCLLFANSPDFEGLTYRCFRDYLWEKSGFGCGLNITGKIDEEFLTVDELAFYFLKKSVFNRERNGEIEVFEPVNIKDYFENPKYGAKEKDINNYLSFKTVELTSRGTLEVRGDCTQKEGHEFEPPAFNLGIRENAVKADKRINEFFKTNDIKLSNSVLRDIVAEGKDVTLIAPLGAINGLLKDMLEISLEGLKMRSLCEEIILEKKETVRY